jgi:DNA-binding protein H-NS
MNLKSMSIDRLIGLRQKVDAALGNKVVDQRRTLESELSRLTRFQAGAGGFKTVFGRGARRPVAPKYRSPENPSETWAGRGLKPRWLSTALKAGHKIEEFLIARAGKAAAGKTTKGKKGRKASARKSSKPRKVAARKGPATKATPQTEASA